MEDKEKIMIYGDYDVDGITSISVLQKFLSERGLEVESHIPNRLEEGYGLNKSAISEIYDKGYRLMITVDCGISATEEIEFANSIKDVKERAEALLEAKADFDLWMDIYPESEPLPQRIKIQKTHDNFLDKIGLNPKN